MQNEIGPANVGSKICDIAVVPIEHRSTTCALTLALCTVAAIAVILLGLDVNVRPFGSLHLQVPNFVIVRFSGPNTFLSNGNADRTGSIVMLQVGKTPLYRFEVPSDVVPDVEDSEAASARDSFHVKVRDM